MNKLTLIALSLFIFTACATSVKETESVMPNPADKPCATGSQEPGCLPSNPNSTDERMCTREFKPVCGDIQVQCITTPCNDIRTTFENRCEAEKAGATNITEGACVDEEPNLEGACLSFDGNWIEMEIEGKEVKECEWMGQEQCETLGGTYNECASACRNDPNAEMCTMQCVQVCRF